MSTSPVSPQQLNRLWPPITDWPPPYVPPIPPWYKEFLLSESASTSPTTRFWPPPYLPGPDWDPDFGNGSATRGVDSPRSRDEFAAAGAQQPGPASPPADTAPQQGRVRLDDKDRATLNAALASVRQARSDRGKDSRDSRTAEGRLVLAVSYLVGFLESKGLQAERPSQPSELFGDDVRIDRDSLLDELEDRIEDLAGAGGTRHPVGDGLIAVGSALLSAAVGALLAPTA